MSNRTDNLHFTSNVTNYPSLNYYLKLKIYKINLKYTQYDM